METKYRSHFTEWKSPGYGLYFSPCAEKKAFAGEGVCDRNLRIFLGQCEESSCSQMVAREQQDRARSLRKWGEKLLKNMDGTSRIFVKPEKWGIIDVNERIRVYGWFFVIMEWSWDGVGGEANRTYRTVQLLWIILQGWN